MSLPSPAASRPSWPRAPATAALWLPVVALVLGLLAASMVFAPLPWSGLQRLATSPLAAAAVALGCVALARQEHGQAQALAGVALGAAGLMGAAVLALL